jgi:hypothetical protein
MANENLTKAKRAKNDEFYTQYADIQKEMEAYLEYDADAFRDKVVYCNCDDPFESNFFRYFVLNFRKLGLKRLITTSYKPSPVANTQLALFGDDDSLPKRKGRPKVTANKFLINEVHEMSSEGEFNLKSVAKKLKANKNNEWSPLEGDGDFRSAECIELLQQADIIVTNPPFSLFREYVKQLFDYDKKFVIIGNKNAVTYKEIFPLIKNNKMWSGKTGWGGGLWFVTTDSDDVDRVVDGQNMKNVSSVWFTNIDHGRRHEPLPLMTMQENLRFSRHKEIRGKKKYDRYDNYDAIEVPFTDAIPSDYVGVMGVPISFLDKYNPDQFEIVGTTESNAPDNACRTKIYTSQECRDAYLKIFGKPGVYDLNASGVVNGIKVFKRVLIRKKT